MKVPQNPPRPMGLLKLAFLVAFTAPLTLSNAPMQVRYALDSSASDVRAKVSFFGFASKTARFPEMKGAVVIVPDAPERASIDVTFDARLIEAPDSVTLKRLRGEKFFWVEKYPEIRFVGRSLKFNSSKKGTLDGTLTARGVSRPQTLKITFDTPPLTAQNGQPISFEGETRIDRRDYGMKSYQLIVGNNVDIRLKARMVPS